MTAENKIRQYVILTPNFQADRTRLSIQMFFADLLKSPGATVLPFAPWQLFLEGSDSFHSTTLGELVVLLELNTSEVDTLRSIVREDRTGLFGGVGAVLPMNVAEHWCPREAPYPIFGNRIEARRLIGADYLARKGAKGKKVNIVVVDRGVDKNYIRSLGATFGGGWWRKGLPLPGETVGGHGMMIVRNILDIAPDATIFDCPLLGDLPGHITDIPKSTDDAARAYKQMIEDIKLLRLQTRWQGPWIFENAWAVYDRKSEHPLGDYTNNPANIFNSYVGKAAAEKIDVVFCAGNCGQFCPDPACGQNDRGPGESILGANSHADVLTASAVRTDTIWLGYSSQGPGQPLLDPQKPDFCAPSQFSEVADPHATNTGTSAACALTAGVVAALRSKWDADAVTAKRLKQVLKDTATRTKTGAGWEGRVGSGILNAEAAFNSLP
jgi:subtilisin family serine protease